MKDFSMTFETDFIKNITPESQKKLIIENAIVEIKSRLRKELKNEHDIGPRFMTQGSAGYKTQNSPCWDTQQIDYDIGCYFPFSEWEDEKPKKAAKDFFSEVDIILKTLCDEREWELDITKNTCCRVIIDKDIHIDIPLYSIPDNEFKTITESVEARKSFSIGDSSYPEEESWENFNFQKVLLAQREGDWKESDPRKVNLYFKDAFEKKGEQFRRICRYLKAWRDFKWQSKGPTSIFLMCLADSLYTCNRNKGDDEELYNILVQIPQKLNLPVINNAENENLTKRNIEYIDSLKSYAVNFARDLGKALSEESIDGTTASELIRNHLGDRFPIKHNLPPKKSTISDEIHDEKISQSSAKPLLRTRAG